MTSTPDAAARRTARVLPLKKRLAIIAAVAAFGLAALLRWERWQCLDANGRVLAQSSAWLWSGQHLDHPIIPRGASQVESRTFHLVPPILQVRRVPSSLRIP